jgi:alpha-mannosidase
MENEYLHITIQDNGGLRVADKVTGRTYNDLNVFEDGGDAGEEYNYSPPKFDSVHMTGAGSLTSVARVASGPHVARFEVEHAWALPKALADDRSTRSAERTTCKVESLVTLKAGSPYLEIHTTIENVAKDHRIRALFPLPACVDTAYAEGVFTVNARRTQPAESRADETETNPNTHPQKCFVDAGDEAAGLAVFNVGLPEYEVKDQKVLALTLLRAVGWLARDDFQSRDTSIGTRRSLPAPGAQCIDRYEYDYAVMPHRGQWVEARVHKHAHQFNNRLHLHQKSVVELRDDGTLDPIYGFVKVEPAALNVSALKRADAHPHLILRIYNISNGPVDGAIRLDRNIGKVRRSNFAEEGFEEIAINDQTVNLRFGPHEVMTFLLETI